MMPHYLLALFEILDEIAASNFRIRVLYIQNTDTRPLRIFDSSLVNYKKSQPQWERQVMLSHTFIGLQKFVSYLL